MNISKTNKNNDLDSMIDAAEKEAEISATNKGGQIETILDELYEINLEELNNNTQDFQNVLFEGVGGSGKTSRVIAWAKNKGINLVHVKASTMDATDLGGAITPDNTNEIVKRLASTEFDALDENPEESGYSVLFLDEFNRANRDVRGTLLDLVQSHAIPDPRVKNSRRILKSMLFTVAAINPADEFYNTDQLDDAEMSRFRYEKVYHDNKNALQFYKSTWAEKINKTKNPKFKERYKKQLDLITTLLEAKKFEFDGKEDIKQAHKLGNGLILSERTLTNLLINSDGTKENFLSLWNNFCNKNKKQTVELLLTDYQDKADKANSVFDDPSASELFKGEESAWDKIMKSGILDS